MEKQLFKEKFPLWQNLASVCLGFKKAPLLELGTQIHFPANFC